MPQKQGTVNNGPHECSCGKWYPTLEAVGMCQQNRHGSGKDKYNDTYEFNQCLTTEIKVTCAECGTPLAYIKTQDKGGDLRLDVLPHVCAVDEPEEEVAA